MLKKVIFFNVVIHNSMCLIRIILNEKYIFCLILADMHGVTARNGFVRQ